MGLLLLTPLILLLSFYCCGRCQQPGGCCERYGDRCTLARWRAQDRCQAACLRGGARLGCVCRRGCCCGFGCCCLAVGAERDGDRPFGRAWRRGGGAGGGIELVVGARPSRMREDELEADQTEREQERVARRMLCVSRVGLLSSVSPTFSEKAGERLSAQLHVLLMLLPPPPPLLCGAVCHATCGTPCTAEVRMALCCRFSG